MCWSLVHPPETSLKTTLIYTRSQESNHLAQPYNIMPGLLMFYTAPSFPGPFLNGTTTPSVTSCPVLL